jgi:hypothetical protein
MTNNTTVTRIPLFPSIEAGCKGSAPRSEWGLALKEHISYSGVTFLLQIGRAKGREVLLSCKKRPPARANRMWGHAGVPAGTSRRARVVDSPRVHAAGNARLQRCGLADRGRPTRELLGAKPASSLAVKIRAKAEASDSPGFALLLAYL